jgi:threonine aldolase
VTGQGAHATGPPGGLAPTLPVAVIPPFDFASDNAVGADPRVFEALTACNDGATTPYGLDERSVEVNELYSRLFEHEAYVFPAPTGTAANGLAIGALTPGYGAVFCHEQSHIVTTECGAPEFYSSGAHLVLLSGDNHRIAADTLRAALRPYRSGNLHRPRAATLSLTQLTEGGTSYSGDELAALAEVAHSAELRVHMDGARFANAMVHRGLSPAEMSWRAGVDILSLGLTKNGGMNIDAVVCFDLETALILRYLHKRAGFLYSKMRFAAAQLGAYARGGLWADNARTANSNARRLAAALLKRAGTRLEDEIQGNQVFMHIPAAVARALEQAGFRLRPWAHPDNDLFRLVGAFNDPEKKLSQFERALAG